MHLKPSFPKYFLIFTIIIIASCSQKRSEIPIQEKDFCAEIHRDSSTSLSQELKVINDSLAVKTGVYVLEDGDGSMVTRAWLTEYAEKTIDIQYFIFSTDNVGLIACDYLVRAADRGVQVRILVDDIMVDAGIHEILTMDSHPNISIKIYNPGVNLGKNIVQKLGHFATNFRSANQRMHNKTFVVDGKIGITCGRNIADEYFDYDHEYNFRDRDVLLIGKVNGVIENLFQEFWESPLSIPVTELAEEKSNNYKDSSRFGRLHQYACNPDNFWPQVREKIIKLPLAFREIRESGKIQWIDSVNFVSDNPGKNAGAKGLAGGGKCTDALIALIKKAKYNIDIQSPYLITTEISRKLFDTAIKRGVKIRILTNSLASTDNLEAFNGYQRDRKKLLATGIRIFEFKPDAKERFQMLTGALQKKINYVPIFGLHAKSMVIDGNITVIGTFNIDPRSANLNTECVAIIYSNNIAKGVQKGMETEFKQENSWETTNSFNPDSVAGTMKQIKTGIRRLIPKQIL